MNTRKPKTSKYQTRKVVYMREGERGGGGRERENQDLYWFDASSSQTPSLVINCKP